MGKITFKIGEKYTYYELKKKGYLENKENQVVKEHASSMDIACSAIHIYQSKKHIHNIWLVFHSWGKDTGIYKCVYNEFY